MKGPNGIFVFRPARRTSIRPAADDRPEEEAQEAADDQHPPPEPPESQPEDPGQLDVAEPHAAGVDHAAAGSRSANRAAAASQARR